jgi:hypothetical protein
VAIVESEKSALIASAVFPDLVWLGAGNIHGLSTEKCQVLKNRNVILFPDLNAFEKWNEKATQIKKQCNCKISASTLLEDIATPEAKKKGLDVADFMIDQLTSKPEIKSIDAAPLQTRFSPELVQMTETNPALLLLINKLELTEH